MPNFGEFFRRDKYAYKIKFDVDLAKFLTIITPNFRVGMDKFAPNLGKIWADFKPNLGAIIGSKFNNFKLYLTQADNHKSNKTAIIISQNKPASTE